MRDDHVPAWRRWLPIVEIGGTLMADREWEAEGRFLHIRWGRIIIELQLAIIDREFGEEPADAR